VVKEVKNPPAEISFKEAKDLDSEVQVGDSLGTKIDVTEFGRIAAQTAKQVIIQRVKDAERRISSMISKTAKEVISARSTVRADRSSSTWEGPKRSFSRS
jgi:hypothetical protein